MTINPAFEPKNLSTPHQEIELSFVPNWSFKLRKADFKFEAWCDENYKSKKDYITLVMSAGQPGGPSGKDLSQAVLRAFYHLLSREDQMLLRDRVQIENPLDEDGEEIKYNIIDKLMIATTPLDLTNITRAIFVATELAEPNALTDEEKKKKKGSPRKGKITK